MEKTSNRRERTHERAQESEIPQICSHILRSLIKSYTHAHIHLYLHTHTETKGHISSCSMLAASIFSIPSGSYNVSTLSSTVFLEL